MDISSTKKWLKDESKLVLYLASAASILFAAVYTGYVLGKQSGINQVSQLPNSVAVDKDEETPQVTDKKDREQETTHEQPLPTAEDKRSQSSRTIPYSPSSDWPVYTSPVGYSLQYPPSLGEIGPNTEFKDNACITLVSNNVGGVMGFKVVSYNGGSRRLFYFHSSSYFGGVSPTWTKVTYEDVFVAGTNALVIYFGDEQFPDFGLGMAVVIPKENAALVIDYPRRTNVAEWEKILGTVLLDSALDTSKCAVSFTDAP